MENENKYEGYKAIAKLVGTIAIFYLLCKSCEISNEQWATSQAQLKTKRKIELVMQARTYEKGKTNLEGICNSRIVGYPPEDGNHYGLSEVYSNASGSIVIEYFEKCGGTANRNGKAPTTWEGPKYEKISQEELIKFNQAKNDNTNNN